MMKKIVVMLLMVLCLVGCHKNQDLDSTTNLAPDIFDSIVDESWYRSTEGCGETICFHSDETFIYYEDCGNPVEDYDCFEEYSYDEETGIITVYANSGKGKRKIKIVSCENNTLVLNFSGDKREFHKASDSLNETIEPISLACDTTITEYDVTGDGRNDEIQISCVELAEEYEDAKYGTKWCLMLNGEVALTFEPEMMARLEVDLYQVSNERNYLFIKQNLDSNDDIIGAALYRFDENEIVEEFDFYNMLLQNINELHSQINVSFMTEDYLTISCSNQFNATARMDWEMNYEYEYAQESWVACEESYLLMYDETLEYKAIGMTANQKILVYEDWTCENKAFHVQKGEVVHLSEIRFYEGRTYFKVENAEGESGWFPDPDRADAEVGDEYLYGYFEEAIFAG